MTADASTPEYSTPRGPTGGEANRGGRHVVTAAVLTALAALLVFVALIVPSQIGEISPPAFLRIPVEGLLGIALVLVLPAKASRIVAAVAGALLGVLTIVRVFDLGFQATLARPFQPVFDWTLLGDAAGFLVDSIGRPATIGLALGLGLLAVAVPVLMSRAVLRLSRLVVGHWTAASRATAVLTTAWIICAVAGVQIVTPVPVAARGAASLAYKETQQVAQSLRDRGAFAREVTVDAYRNTPGDQLLTALRGKDVLFTFVESYGRVAIEDPRLAPRINAILDNGTRQLGAAGFGARSGFLSSPAFGAGSVLAHATFLSGLWIDNVQRHENLLATNRLTLTSAFRRAGWQTVAMMPGNTKPWPEGAFYGDDRVYGAADLGYRGPSFSWATMPDQYALSAFQRLEHGRPNHAPMMVEFPLISSHSPWAPLPRLVGWDDIGDGSIFTPMASQGDSPTVVWQDPERVRAAYGQSIEYSLNSLISYVENYGDDNLVLVFLGDHQPAPIVAGSAASHDVPITIVTRDHALLDRIGDWHWSDGLRPDPHAPVWRMDSFRDRFLAAFGSSPGPPRQVVAAPAVH